MHDDDDDVDDGKQKIYYPPFHNSSARLRRALELSIEPHCIEF